MKQQPEENGPDLDAWKSKPVKKKIDKRIAEGFLLKVELSGITPAIWRSFTVPAELTLGDLHLLLQLIMGWNNSHMHGFRDEDNCYGPPAEPVEGQIDENSALLSDMFPKKGSTILYDYDFGDDWEHLITCKEVLSKLPEIAVIDGKRACPPDDCGGVPGYYEILKVLDGSTDDCELRDWLDDDYDPKFFDAEQVNRALTKASIGDL